MNHDARKPLTLKPDLPDHASEPDHRSLPIDRVGIRGLRYPIRVLDKNADVQHTVASLGLYVGLPKEFKGTHMSRFIEVLNSIEGEVTLRSTPELLSEIQRRLDSDDAFIEVEFPYFITKAAPVSGALSRMEYECRFEASMRGPDHDFVLVVRVPVKSLCPCSKAISDRGAHNQRSIIEVAVRSTQFIWIEDVVEAVERCGSAPVYALLKREDEKFVTEQAYDNPKFVEDLVRDVVLSMRAFNGVHWVRVQADNHESIHNHSAFAEIEWSAEKEDVHRQMSMDLPVHAPDSSSFGEWLKRERLNRSMNQSELAGRLGLTSSYLSRLESDEREPTRAVLHAVASAFGLDPEIVHMRAGHLPADVITRLQGSPERYLRLLRHT